MEKDLNELINDANRNMMNYHEKNKGIMFTHADIARFIIEQGTLNKSLAKSTESLATDMKDIKESMQKQEILLEKLSNLESKIEDNNKRVHKRIDIEVQNRSERFKDIKDSYDYQIKDIKESYKLQITELKDEQIAPLQKSLDKAWWFILTKLIGLVIGLIAVIYNLLTKS